MKEKTLTKLWDRACRIPGRLDAINGYKRKMTIMMANELPVNFFVAIRIKATAIAPNIASVELVNPPVLINSSILNKI